MFIEEDDHSFHVYPSIQNRIQRYRTDATVQTETGPDRRPQSGPVRNFCLSVQTGLDRALYGPDRSPSGPLSDYG